MCKPHIGIIADQEKQILKFLYLGVCIGGFRRIYIDKEIVDKLILRVIKRGYFSSKVNDSFPVGYDPVPGDPLSPEVLTYAVLCRC